MKRATTVAMAVVVSLVVAAGASAGVLGTVYSCMSSVSPGLTMSTWVTPYDTSWFNGLTGRCNMSYSNYSPGAPAVSGPAYCTEVEGWRLGSWYTMNIRPVSETPVSSGPADTGYGPMGAAKAEALRELWGRFYALANDNVSCAAFQLAVWEITYEDLYVPTPPGWDVTVGKFKALDGGGNTTLAINQANTWLGQITGTGPKAVLYGLSLGGVQDVIVTPEPATMAFLSLGGIGLLLSRRRGK